MIPTTRTNEDLIQTIEALDLKTHWLFITDVSIKIGEYRWVLM
jgi:hypothetical protein